MIEHFIDRFRLATRWSVGHLSISVLVAILSAGLVFGLWYPAPWREMLNVTDIFILLMIADVICGPLLTLILISPKKSQHERWIDLSLIGFFQLIALVYGLNTVFSARPVILAFEVDRFVIVTANEVQIENLSNAPIGLQNLSWTGVQSVSLRQSSSQDEYLQSIEQSIGGVTQPMRPQWWRPYNDAKSNIISRSKALIKFTEKNPTKLAKIKQIADDIGLSISNLNYLPLTSSKNSDWMILLTKSGDIVGYVHEDAFDDKQ